MVISLFTAVLQKSSGRVPYPSSAASYTLLNGAGTLSIDRTAFASPPVTGNLDVHFNGQSRTGIKSFQK